MRGLRQMDFRGGTCPKSPLKAAWAACSRVLLAGCVCASLEVGCARTYAADPADKDGYRFNIGNLGEKGPAAVVAVDQVVLPAKKATLLKLAKQPVPVVRGIAVRFEHVQVHALDELPAAVQALTKTSRFQMQRVAFFAPGDPVPRLMAEEAVVRAPGEWLLKGVLLSDRPSQTQCRLVWNKGEARLAFAKGKTLGLKSLLAARDSGN